MNTLLYTSGPSTRSNQSLERPLTSLEQASMMAAAAEKLEELFDILRIDHQADHNTRDTPTRVAKMYVEEILRGRFVAPPIITEFDNIEAYGGLIVTGPIELRSMCAHHLMPIYGHAYIGVLPSPEGKIIGLSKYDRVVEHFASRLQIQEELAQQISSYLVEKTAPRGLAVRISAVHMCKTHRGIRSSHQSRMVNTVFHGELAENAALRADFLRECCSLERNL